MPRSRPKKSLPKELDEAIKQLARKYYKKGDKSGSKAQRKQQPVVQSRDSDGSATDGSTQKPSSSVSSRNSSISCSDMDDDDPPGYPAENVGVNKILGRYDRPLSNKDAERWLKKAEKGAYEDKVMTDPPVKPRGGDIFLYRCREIDAIKDNDFLCDQYTGFEMTGSNSTSKTSVYKRYYKLLDDTGEPLPFSKHVLELAANRSKPKKMVIIHYMGDESVWQPRVHGNSKKGKEYTRTTKECRENTRKVLKLTGNKARKTYYDILGQRTKRDDWTEREKVVGPRDLVQIENEKKKLDSERRLLKCEIFSCVEMSRNETLGTFIRRLVLVPYELIVIADTEALRLGNNLLDSAMKDPETVQLVTYDTTYKLGNAYVSTIVMRNTYLKGDPIFGLIYAMHERRLGKVHKEIWAVAKQLVPKLQAIEKNVPIAVDRERALENAILQYFPKSNLVYCVNHIRRDIRRWIKDHGGAADDLEVLLSDLRIMIKAESPESLKEMYKERKVNWSRSFKEYVKTHLMSDIGNHAAWYYTKKFGAFKNKEATTNISESLHNLIKLHNLWSSLRIDSLVLSLFNLQLTQLGEFNRAYREAGSYVRKDEFKTAVCPFELKEYVYYDEEEFVKFFKAGIYNPKENIEKDENGEYLQSRQALAKIVCDRNLISLDSRAAVFHVTGIYNRKSAVVSRGIDGTIECTCKSTGLCFHRLAVLHSLRVEVEKDDYSYSLSVLGKKTRGFKPGAKGNQRQEFILSVDAADDSEKKMKEKKIAQDLADLDLDGGGSDENDDRRKVDAPEPIPHEPLVIISSESDDDDAGINPYTFSGFIASGGEDTQSNRSRRSIASDPATPAKYLFGNVPEKALKALKPLLETPTYSCLKDKQQIYEDIINDFVAFLIKAHSLELNIALVNTYGYHELCKETQLHKAVSLAHNIEGLNSDIIMVNVLANNHFLLALVLYRRKEIVVVDSFLGEVVDLRSVFKPIMRLVAATHIVAEAAFSVSEWNFVLETEVARQDNCFDCGIHVCLNAYNIVRKEPFYNTDNFPQSQAARRWILYCLKEQGQTPINLRPKPRSRIPAQLRIKYQKELESIAKVIPAKSCQKDSRFQAIKDEIKTGSQGWGKCAGENCTGIHDNDDDWYLCVICRKWYYSGTCVNEEIVPVQYYFCKTCGELQRSNQVQNTDKSENSSK